MFNEADENAAGAGTLGICGRDQTSSLNRCFSGGCWTSHVHAYIL